MRVAFMKGWLCCVISTPMSVKYYFIASSYFFYRHYDIINE